MATVFVPAKKALVYQGRSYVRGELVKCEAVDALALARRGDVSLTRGTTIQTRELTAQVEPEPGPTPARRRYQRRDLTAEGSRE